MRYESVREVVQMSVSKCVALYLGLPIVALHTKKMDFVVTGALKGMDWM